MYIPKKPKGYEDALGEFGPQLFDSYSGEPVAWGFRIIRHLGDKFDALRLFGKLECSYPDWFLITKELTFKEAIEKYGKVTSMVTGPRGGFRKITFGETEFSSKRLAPNFREGERVDSSLIQIQK